MTLSLEHIWFTYRSRHRPAREVFRDLSFDISGGESVALLGEEGSGKSTLLRLMDGLLVPDQGVLRADGVDLHENRKRAVSVRRKIGFAFQFPEEQFMCETIGKEFGDLLRIRRVTRDEAGVRAGDALRQVGLDPAGLTARSPFTLSIGESRRVALALILAIRPDVVIMDEPTAGLDASGVTAVVALLSTLRDRGVALLVATHDVDFAAEVATRIVILEGGKVASKGEAGSLLTDHALLARCGYRAPETVLIADDLRRAGWSIPSGIIRIAELRALPGLAGRVSK